MNTLTRLIIASILGALMLSCNLSMNWGPGIDGDRNVVMADRTISENFDQVKVSQGLDLFITQGKDISLSVEADENLHELIMTEVEDNVLKIYTSKNIRNAASRKIILNIIDIKGLKASSGSDVFSTNVLKLNTLNLDVSSGADVELNLDVQRLNCESSSGSDIRLSGTANELVAEASSGSDIQASNLKTQTSRVKASSGSDITVNTSKALTARASSGGDIKYYGNPETVDASDSSSGSIRKQ